MKRFLIFCGIMLFLSGSLFAQDITITGTVVDAEDDETIPGVSVVVKGTTIGTTTDIDGNYEITAPADAVLEFSYVGMETKEVSVDGRSEINVTMMSDLLALEEVIVVAYGTATRETFTGSASTVSASQIDRVPVTSIEQALAGAAAGVDVSTLSGQPGSFTSMRVRGVGSISSSNEPLYVIDGIPVQGGSMSQHVSTSASPLQSLNPNDIESITILKDAAAASLYGSRAANGVVLITTKSGAEQDTRFTARSSLGFNDFAVPYFPVASQEKNYEVKHEGFYNHALHYQEMSEGDALAYADEQMAAYFYHYDPDDPWFSDDWEDELFRLGASQEHQFSATGGTEATQYYTSFNYSQQDGYSIRNDFERLTGRLNLDHQAYDWLEFGINASIASTAQNVVPDRAFYYVNPTFARQQYLNPLFPVWEEDGTFNQDIVGGQYPNLVRDLPLNLQTTNSFRSTNRGYVEVNPLEELTIRSSIGYDANLVNEDRYWSPESSDGEAHGGYGHKRHRIINTINWSNTVTYETDIADVHNIEVLAGYEIEDVYDESTTTQQADYPNAILRASIIGAEPLAGGNYWSEERLISYLSRLNYNYDDTYYISGSYRRDGSTKLGVDERWGDFFSVSGSVRLTQLDFMDPTRDWLDDWKIRASFGTNGTLPTARYGHMALYGYGYDYNLQPGMSITQVYNPRLRWEQSENMNIGTDLTLFDRLTLDFEYYQRTTEDLLLEVPVSRVSGFDNT